MINKAKLRLPSISYDSSVNLELGTSVRFFPSWIVAMCLNKFPLCVKVDEHREQLKGFSLLSVPILPLPLSVRK